MSPCRANLIIRSAERYTEVVKQKDEVLDIYAGFIYFTIIQISIPGGEKYNELSLKSGRRLFHGLIINKTVKRLSRLVD